MHSRIYFLRREVINFYRAVHPLLAVARIVQGGSAPALLPYFRDVHDNLALIDEEVAAQRDLLKKPPAHRPEIEARPTGTG